MIMSTIHLDTKLSQNYNKVLLRVTHAEDCMILTNDIIIKLGDLSSKSRYQSMSEL